MYVNITSIYYRTTKGKLLVYLCGRGADGKRKVYTLHNTVPYLYVPVEEEQLASAKPNVTRVESNYGKTIYGTPVSRVEVQFPYHVPEVRKGLTHFEADILYDYRIRYDYGITGIIDLPEHQADITPADIKPTEWGKVPFITPHPAYVDIETDMEKNILSVATYEPDTDSAFILVNAEPHPERATLNSTVKDLKAKVIESLKESGTFVPKNISIAFMRNENELLDYFKNYLQLRQPDVLVAWNGWEFDFNILEEKKSALFTGIGLFDMMFGYAMFYRAKYGELESKGLDYCAKQVLGHGKVGLTGQRPQQTYRDSMPWFIFYNLSDVLLMVEMERKVHVVNHYMYLACLTGIDIRDSPSEVKIVESTIFQMLRGKKIILPSKAEKVEKEKVGGGKVAEPSTGLMDYVTYIDLKGEYPAIMRTFNLSPETLVREGEEVKVPVYTVPPNDIKVKSEPIGIVPQILTLFTSERDAMKREMKKYMPETPEYNAIFERQEAFKFLMNSFTGVMGNEYFRLYNPDIINAVTGTGRAHLLWIRGIVENKCKLKVLYADTDGTFISTDAKTLEDAIKIGKDMNKIVNESFDDFVNQYGVKSHVFSIAFKKVYGKWFQSAKKKKWTGLVVWEDGMNLIEKNATYIETKGYATRRSDNSDWTRWLQKELFNLLFNKGLDEAVAFLKAQYKELSEGKVKIEDLGIPIGLNKEEYANNAIQKRAADYSRENLGKDINVGDKIKYYFVEEVKGFPPTDVVALLREEKVPDIFKIKLFEHIRRCFVLPIEPILEGLGVPMSTVTGGAVVGKEVGKTRSVFEFE
jgi:DNA polymerase elongation subunit (family B)